MFTELNGFAVIYMFTSPSGKKYIGQSICFNHRYKKYLKNTNSIGKYFSRAISKYNGIENFKLDILAKFELLEDITLIKKELDKLEQYYIEKYDTLKEGYNLTGGGKGSFKRLVTEETRLKLSLSNLGKRKVQLVELICPICEEDFKRRPGQISKRVKQGVTPTCSKLCGIEQMKITTLKNKQK